MQIAPAEVATSPDRALSSSPVSVPVTSTTKMAGAKANHDPQHDSTTTRTSRTSRTSTSTNNIGHDGDGGTYGFQSLSLPHPQQPKHQRRPSQARSPQEITDRDVCTPYLMMILYTHPN